jgi:2-methylcitrate dehydratase PrpD
MTASPIANGLGAAQFVAGMAERNLDHDHELLDAAKKCLVDWVGVALGAHGEDAAKTVRKVVAGWGSQGNARLLLGASCAPTAAAMGNGTMAHCLDFDDTHAGSVAHFSGPTWAAVLALGMDRNRSEREMLSAFIAGYQVGAKLGGQGFGIAVNHRGWHSTGVFACLAAAAASAAMLRLDVDGIQRTLGAAATQTGGITASFGTMSKPFHAGKAAFNGVLSAQLAEAGFVPSLNLLEQTAGLGQVLVPDGAMQMPEADFAGQWEVMRNSFKPYACCLLAHASIDCARELFERVKGRPIAKIEARVNPLAVHLAGKPAPRTPLEGKFSTQFCIALGLSGFPASQIDFSDARLDDPSVRDLTAKVTLLSTPAFAETAAALRVTLADGTVHETEMPVSKGNPDNPMDWDDMFAKFMPLVEPAIGGEARALFDSLRNFERPGQLALFTRIISGPA